MEVPPDFSFFPHWRTKKVVGGGDSEEKQTKPGLHSALLTGANSKELNLPQMHLSPSSP